MNEVRSDSRIRIRDKSGTITSVIFEEDYERLGYKANGWTVDQTDWTKERIVKEPVDAQKAMKLTELI